MRPADLANCDDNALLTRALADDRAAFAQLVTRHQQAALRVAAIISGSTSEAEDIVQDAFVEVHRHLGSYRGTGSVRSWMLRIVANRAKNHVRNRVRRIWRDDRGARLELHVTEGADQIAERRIESESLVAVLARLGTVDREVLACRYVAGLSEAETAEVLGTPAGTVKSRTSRGLERLARELGGNDA